MGVSPSVSQKSQRPPNEERGDKMLIGANLESLDELDVELNIDDIGESLLDKVYQIQMTEDELEELEKEEREKSIIKDHEKDLQELERLEKEITEAETKLRSASLDEDKYLEQANLDDLEKSQPKAKALTLWIR